MIAFFRNGFNWRVGLVFVFLESWGGLCLCHHRNRAFKLLRVPGELQLRTESVAGHHHVRRQVPPGSRIKEIILSTQKISKKVLPGP